MRKEEELGSFNFKRILYLASQGRVAPGAVTEEGFTSLPSNNFAFSVFVGTPLPNYFNKILTGKTLL